MTDLIERECRECKSTGVAEYIDHMARPCDACHGDGVLRFTPAEAGLLDANDCLARENTALREAISEAVAKMRHNVSGGMMWMTHDEVEEIARRLEQVAALKLSEER
jgi:hypothetical protein